MIAPHETIGVAVWTAKLVELRLIDAFRQMPSCPLFTGRHPDASLPRTAASDAVDWRVLLDGDRDGRKYLYAWARCRATRESFADYCRTFGWKGTTAERGRRRAASTIAATLGRDEVSRRCGDLGV